MKSSLNALQTDIFYISMDAHMCWQVRIWANSDLEKVSLIACIGQFCIAMEKHSEPIEKKKKSLCL